jgi:hypothetical protein
VKLVCIFIAKRPTYAAIIGVKKVTGEYFSIHASFWQAEQNNLSLELRILELSSTFRRKFGG